MSTFPPLPTQSLVRSLGKRMVSFDFPLWFMFRFLEWLLLSAPSQVKCCNGKNKRWEKKIVLHFKSHHWLFQVNASARVSIGQVFGDLFGVILRGPPHDLAPWHALWAILQMPSHVWSSPSSLAISHGIFLSRNSHPVPWYTASVGKLENPHNQLILITYNQEGSGSFLPFSLISQNLRAAC